MAAPPPSTPAPPSALPPPVARSLVDALPDDLIADLAARLLAADIAWFWILSRVSAAFKRAAEEAAARKTRLGGDAASVAFRRKAASAPLEPAVPLARLLRHSPGLVALDLSGGYWWVGAEAAAAVGAAPCARRLRALRLGSCERLTDADLARMVVCLPRAEGRGGASSRGAPDAEREAAAAKGGGETRDQALSPTPPLPPPPPPLPSLPALRVLSLRSCRQLRSAAFLRLLPSLDTLDLAWCVELSDLETHVACAPRLRVLDATGVEGANDAMCARLPRGLEELRIAMTSVSDEGLRWLGDAGALPALRRVALARRSNNLWADGRHTDAGVEELRRRRPGAEVELVSV